MDSPLRFACPECGKELKAPREYAGKRVRCTRQECRHSFPIPAGGSEPAPLPLPLPAERDDDFDLSVTRTPARVRRGFPREILWVAAALTVMGGSAFGLYWWVGQPTSAQEAAYENFFRTGNELIDLHEPIATDAQARDARPALRAKAEEHLEYRSALHFEGRRGQALGSRFSDEGQELIHRINALMQSKKPIVVFIGASEQFGDQTLIHLMASSGRSATGSAKWEVKEFLRPADQSTPTPPTASVPQDPSPTPAPPNPVAGTAADPALEGTWKLRSIYSVYTGRDKNELIVNGDHTVAVRGNLIEVIGLVDGNLTGEKYGLELEPGATPKRYTIRSGLNPDDTESGIYRVDKGVLLMRATAMGGAAKNYEFSGASISEQNRAGDDSEIPEGFLRKRGDPGFKVMRFEKVTAERSKPARSEPKPVPKPVVKPIAKPGTIALTELKITKTTFEPPSVEFTIRLDRAGGELLEAWASVGIKDSGDILTTFAGALYGGLLSVNGIDFAKPDPSLKAQRVGMRPSDTYAGLYVCTVKYPKLKLDDPVTEFTIVAAVRKGDNIEKSNAATARVDLKSGKELPAGK